MAVNGVEIKVGQKWVCRDGEVREVVEYSRVDEDDMMPFRCSGGLWRYENGRTASDGNSDFDFITIERSIVEETISDTLNDVSTLKENKTKHSHYFKDVSHLTHIDVYRVLDLFNVTDPCLQHAVKKLLCAGGRGAKDFEKDIREAGDSIARKLEMIKEDAKKIEG